jgi:dihydroxyacetone kinase-like protein
MKEGIQRMQKITVTDLVKMVEIMSEIIIENEVPFCELDSAAGDGDFGMSLSKGFRELRKEWDGRSRDDIGGFLKDCSMIITEYCGGASGPIWGSAFRAASKYAAGKTELDLAGLSELLQSAVDGIQKRGGAKLGDKTLLDALIPAVEALKQSSAAGESLEPAMKKSAQAAVKGAEDTTKMVASKGRASYVGERSLNYPDAGAHAIGVIFTGIVQRICT